jgi:hypothetical protein
MKKDEIIILCTFKDILEATLALDKLKANKIDSFLEDETNSGINPLDGVKLKVFSKDKARADKIVTEFKN